MSRNTSVVCARCSEAPRFLTNLFYALMALDLVTTSCGLMMSVDLF
jgi:hypothetical protein